MIDNLPALRSVYKLDLTMMPRCRARQVYRACVCKCLEESVDNETLRKYAQEDRFRYWDGLIRRRKGKGAVMHQRTAEGSEVSMLGRDVTRMLIPRSSSTIFYVNVWHVL